MVCAISCGLLRERWKGFPSHTKVWTRSGVSQRRRTPGLFPLRLPFLCPIPAPAVFPCCLPCPFDLPTPLAEQSQSEIHSQRGVTLSQRIRDGKGARPLSLWCTPVGLNRGGTNREAGEDYQSGQDRGGRKEGNLTPTQPWKKVGWFKVRRGWIMGIHSPRKWRLGMSYKGLPLGRGGSDDDRGRRQVILPWGMTWRLQSCFIHRPG